LREDWDLLFVVFLVVGCRSVGLRVVAGNQGNTNACSGPSSEIAIIHHSFAVAIPPTPLRFQNTPPSIAMTDLGIIHLCFLQKVYE
jgi:hypothetical protein